MSSTHSVPNPRRATSTGSARDPPVRSAFPASRACIHNANDWSGASVAGPALHESSACLTEPPASPVRRPRRSRLRDAPPRKRIPYWSTLRVTILSKGSPRVRCWRPWPLAGWAGRETVMAGKKNIHMVPTEGGGPTAARVESALRVRTTPRPRRRRPVAQRRRRMASNT